MASAVEGRQYAVVCYLQPDVPASDPALFVGSTPAECGLNAVGETLYAYMEPVQSGSDSPIPGGEVVGMEVGGAMLLVMASAWAIRSVRRFIDSEVSE
ncbi:hypothetical protein [Paraburkholderia sp. 2C]